MSAPTALSKTGISSNCKYPKLGQIRQSKMGNFTPLINTMKTKSEIVNNWLPRYTGTELNEFGEYILLTNFFNYVEDFARQFEVTVKGLKNAMQTATANNITIINFGMGSAMAATVMDLLSAIKPKAVLFLGKCGGLKKQNKIGDLILPIAAVRGEGTSDDYLPPEIPALPFSISLLSSFKYCFIYSNLSPYLSTSIHIDTILLGCVRIP